MRRRRIRGAGVGSWLKNLYNTVRDKKLISRGLSAIAPYTGSYSPIASGAATVASKLGFGRRRPRMYRGKGLRLAGGARRVRRRYF